MLLLALSALSAGGALLWHLQRRQSQALALSFARLLADPQPSQQPERRFSPVPPLGSAAFWLRMPGRVEGPFATEGEAIDAARERFGAEFEPDLHRVLAAVDQFETELERFADPRRGLL